MSFKRKVVYALFGQWFVAACQFASVVVISRLLSPEEIGVFAVTMALVGMATILQNFGVGEYVLQERNLTLERRRAAFGVSLGMAWLFALALALGGAPFAAFYDEPGMRDVLLVVAAGVALSPLSSPIISMLMRDQAFGALSAIRAVATLAQVGTAIALASLGFSYMSMAYAQLATPVVTLALCLALRPGYALFAPRLRGTRRILAFGGSYSGAVLAGEFGRFYPDLIIGRVLGVDMTAMFSRGRSITTMFSEAVTHGVLPVVHTEFARRHRENQVLREAYLATVERMTSLAWPFFGFAAVAAPDLILFLYGPQWAPAAPVMQIVCIGSLFLMTSLPAGSSLVATGRLALNLRIRVAVNLFRVAAATAACFVGLEAVAAAMALTAVLDFVLSTRAVGGAIGFGFRDVATAARRSAVVAVGSVLAAAATLEGLRGEEVGRFVLLAVSGGVLGVVWLLLLRLTSHPLWREIAATLDPILVRGRLALKAK